MKLCKQMRATAADAAGWLASQTKKKRGRVQNIILCNTKSMYGIQGMQKKKKWKRNEIIM